MTTPLAVGDYPEAGIRVEYHEKPYRLYTVNGDRVPSVTTALGILDKPLEAWIERTTLAGAWKLLHKPSYTLPEDREPATCPWRTRRYVPNFAKKCDNPCSDCIKGDPALCQFHVDLKNKRLDTYSAKRDAADRGVDVHAIWQAWNESKTIPNAGDYPPDRKGYIRAMSTFIMDHSPGCLESEKVVGSATHGFAGRLDTVVTLDLEGTLSCVDIKTSKAVYPSSHFPQLAGYEIARRECGLPPTERQGILRLGANGQYELKWSDAEADDFLAILRAYKSQQRWSRR